MTILRAFNLRLKDSMFLVNFVTDSFYNISTFTSPELERVSKGTCGDACTPHSYPVSILNVNMPQANGKDSPI